MSTLQTRRHVIVMLLGFFGVIVGFVSISPGPVAAQEADSPSEDITANSAGETRQSDSIPDAGTYGWVDVITVDGLIDSVIADFLSRSLEQVIASGDGVAAVIQLNSPGAVIGDDALNELASLIASSPVPVSVWIGPSGSDALGGAAELALAADSVTISPGSTIGAFGNQRLDPDQFGQLLTAEQAEARDRIFEGETAVEAGLVDQFTPTVLEHIGSRDYVNVLEIVTDDGERRLIPEPTVRFSRLPLQLQILHTAASPSVAYLLLALGLGLLLFEFFTAGIGVAGVVGAGFFVLGGYGVAELPFQPWALGLILVSMIAFAVDVQTGIPRVWTVFGMIMFSVGSVFLFQEFSASWIALVVGLAGMATTMFSGMPAMVRTRFGTPTIGREWMLGELGTAVTDIDPEGVVMIRDAKWRAITNRATPVTAGEPIRVVEIDGLVLEIEPEEGGAVDYREMREKRNKPVDSTEQ